MKTSFTGCGSDCHRVLVALLAFLPFAACEQPAGPEQAGEAPTLRSVSPVVVLTHMEGAGSIGNGEPLPDGGVQRQTFEFDVDHDLDGYVAYADYGVMRPSGKLAELHAGPGWPGTAILGFTQGSNSCVKFNGIGRLDTDELVHFEMQACDNGTPGVGLDAFGVNMPLRPYFRGPDMITAGEIVGSGTGNQDVVITSMDGVGAIGDGSPAPGGGIVRQEFALVVDAGGVGGTLDYTDYAVIHVDGNPAHLTVSGEEAGTGITEWVQISNACVEFEGIAKLTNTGELLGFEVRACDGGSGEDAVDVFGLRVPLRPYAKGPDVLSEGELEAEVIVP